MAFGKHGLDLDLPPGPHYTLLHTQAASSLTDVHAAIENALDHPIGTPPLFELARNKKSAVISVCDITRPVPNSRTLPPILDRLHRAGILQSDITLMIATGLHRPATEDEIRRILGPEIATTYRVLNHDAKATHLHQDLGFTKRGIPVSIDKRFLEADLHITLGLIEQHLMLGFSGGRKLIAPGLAAQQTIKAIHSPRFMREAFATEGSTTGNPLHAELLEIASMARHDFLLDVTLTQAREISGVFAGDPVQAHAEGVSFLEHSAIERVPARVDAVITSAAGYPLDLNFYQTVKGVTAVQHILKPGAPILIVSACSEGAGSPEFADMLRNFHGPQQFLDEVEHTPVQIDQWQLEKLALVARNHPVFFYTEGLSASSMGALGENTFSDRDAAVRRLLHGLPPDATVAVIPEGPYTYARVLGDV